MTVPEFRLECLRIIAFKNKHSCNSYELLLEAQELFKWIMKDHTTPENEIRQSLNYIINKLNQMANELQDLTAEVSETKGIMASAKVLIEGFAQKLEEAGTDKEKLAALKDELNAGSEDLATAIAANPLPTENVEPTPETGGTQG